MSKLMATHAPAAALLIRVLVGAVFICEGIQKFLFPAGIGAGRFEKIGIPWPEVTAPLVGCFEIGCGSLVLVGLFTRLAAIPLIVIMVTAMATTKVPILADQGFWKMAHEARTDWSMLLGSVFLLIVGAGPASWDGLATRRARNHERPAP
jgi:putative oxidoreductase